MPELALGLVNFVVEVAILIAILDPRFSKWYVKRTKKKVRKQKEEVLEKMFNE